MTEQLSVQGQGEPEGMTVTLVDDAVHVAGEVDLSTAPSLEASLLSAFEGASPLVVDMSAVEFIDSLGIRALLAASNQRQIRVVQPSAQVRSVIDMAGVAQVLGLD